MEIPEHISDLITALAASGFIECAHENPERVVRSYILGLPSNPPSDELFKSVFPDHYEPGTFTISERKLNPPYITVDDRLSYEDWVISETNSDLEKLIPLLEEQCKWLITNPSIISELPSKVLAALNYSFKHECTLAEEIYQQEYTDIFRRLNLIYLTGWPRVPFNEYDKINAEFQKIGVSLADMCSDVNEKLLMRISAAAGLIGLNHKRNASATAVLYDKGIIPVSLTANDYVNTDMVFSNLVSKAEEDWKIGYEDEFYARTSKENGTVGLVFFPDDYLESIIDLKLIERLMENNDKLHTTIIPRALRFGNDAGYSDITEFLKLDVFSKLASYMKEGRLVIEIMGPLSGTVNGRRLSSQAVEHLNSADVVYVKGARSYECLQGLNTHTFFSFAVCRSLSEAVTGINAETGGLVLIYQEPGVRSFQGFRKRHLRQCESPSGRKYWLAEVTASDSTLEHPLT